jgi:UDP-N-acetylglucosamine 2-epimerase (non-hydrolysing)
MAPVIEAVTQSPRLAPLVISTGQHREMLDQAFSWFGITPDIDLRLMVSNQTSNGLMAAALARLDEIFSDNPPDAVLVQGDTTTALAAAIAAFHRQIPVGHVEAGLRTYDLSAPFPEEANRALITRIAAWNFAPTERAVKAARAEQAPGEIVLTGNTVVDALLAVAKTCGEPPVTLTRSRLILITGHRRENFGDRFRDAFEAIAELASRYHDVDFVYPVHLNPKVRTHAHAILAGLPNVQLIEPVAYPELISLMKRSYLVISDSGGIQEEAPSFGVPVLVMRDTTERPEAVDAGVATLVGTAKAAIIEQVSSFLDHPEKREAVTKIPNPFGDGNAAKRIVAFLEQKLAAPRQVEPARTEQ